MLYATKNYVFFSRQLADRTPVDAFSTRKWSAINRQLEESPRGFFKVVSEDDSQILYKWVELDMNAEYREACGH